MVSTSRRTARLASIAIVAVVLAGCGDDNSDADGDASGTGATTSLSAETTSADDGGADTAAPEGSAAATSDAPATTAAPDDTADPDATVAPGDTTPATASAGTSAPDATADATAPSAATSTTGAPTSASAATTTVGAPTGPAPTYVVVDGDSLFAIAQDAGITVDELVAANGWPDGDAHVIFPGDVVRLAPPADGAVELVSARELLELELTDGASTPIAEPLVDGVYFAITAEPNADDTALVLELAQFRTTEACEAALAASTVPGDTINDSSCLGYQVIETPTATLEVPVGESAPVVLLFGAPEGTVDLLAAEATIDDWRQLLAGTPPAWATGWLPGNAFVQVTDGAVTRIEVSVIGS